MPRLVSSIRNLLLPKCLAVIARGKKRIVKCLLQCIVRNTFTVHWQVQLWWIRYPCGEPVTSLVILIGQQKMSVIVRDLWIYQHEEHQQAFNNHKTLWILVYCLVWKIGNILGRVIYFPLMLKADEKHEEGNLSFVTSAWQIWVPWLLQIPEHLLSLQVIKGYLVKWHLLQRRLLDLMIPVPGLAFKPHHA